MIHEETFPFNISKGAQQEQTTQVSKCSLFVGDTTKNEQLGFEQRVYRPLQQKLWAKEIRMRRNIGAQWEMNTWINIIWEITTVMGQHRFF